MSQAAAIMMMLTMVLATVVATRMARDDGAALIAAVAGGTLGVLVLLGADSSQAFAGLSPLLMIVGYAALAGVLTEAGVTGMLVKHLGPSPVLVLLAAAVASAFLSNDIVIVAFAPVVLLRKTRVIDAAALFVGANITGGLLPQGSPTNLMLLGNRSFFSYLQVSAPVTAAMFVVALLVFVCVWRFAPHSWTRPDSHLEPEGEADSDGFVDSAFDGGWDVNHRKGLLVLALCAVAAQPVFDLLHIPRVVLGWTLLMVAAATCKAVRIPIGRVMSQAPWQIAAVVLVLSAGAPLLIGTGTSSYGELSWVAQTFMVSALGTDILAAALAAAGTGSSAHSSAAALVAVTAGAFATPIASISGILLLEAHQKLKAPLAVRTFLVAGATSVLCFVAGTAVALSLYSSL